MTRLTLGEQIRDRRTALGMSQMDLAALLNTTQAAISQYEIGTRRPRGLRLEQIADALGCDVRLVPRGGAMTAPGAPFEPGQVAALDQIAARADEQLDGEIAWMREHIEAAGADVGTAAIVVYLLEHGNHRSLAMAYAWALRRLAGIQGGAR